jgi:tellurite resistance protein
MDKVKNHPNLAKDKSGIIHNINKDEIKIARRQKLARRKKEEEIDQLKKDVDDIKSLLHQLIEKQNAS